MLKKVIFLATLCFLVSSSSKALEAETNSTHVGSWTSITALYEGELGCTITHAYCRIGILYTEPEFRGIGCATLLMNKAIAQMEELGCETITLLASPQDDSTDFDKLVKFYGNFGFVRDGEISPGELFKRWVKLIRFTPWQEIWL